ncbi:hypothetical protein FRC08_013518, partial [Ceratobasidium sp. 394]
MTYRLYSLCVRPTPPNRPGISWRWLCYPSKALVLWDIHPMRRFIDWPAVRAEFDAIGERIFLCAALATFNPDAKA